MSIVYIKCQCECILAYDCTDCYEEELWLEAVPEAKHEVSYYEPVFKHAGERNDVISKEILEEAFVEADYEEYFSSCGDFADCDNCCKCFIYAECVEIEYSEYDEDDSKYSKFDGYAGYDEYDGYGKYNEYNEYGDYDQYDRYDNIKEYARTYRYYEFEGYDYGWEDEFLAHEYELKELMQELTSYDSWLYYMGEDCDNFRPEDYDMFDLY